MSRDAGHEGGEAAADVRVSSRSTWTLAVVLLAVVGAAGFTVWYRGAYNVFPGQDAAGRVHWCGRDYQGEGGSVTRRQAVADARWPLHDEGFYPPLALSREVLFAATYPAGLKTATPCATLVFLRTGPDAYKPYGLEGGP
jgi:hypothetical protein